MSASQDARRPRNPRAVGDVVFSATACNESLPQALIHRLQPSIALTSSKASGAVSSGFGDDTQELLGLSAGSKPMTFTSSLSRTLTNSSGPGPQFYTTDPSSDNSFPQDLELSDPHGSQQDWEGYKLNDSNGNQADPLQRLASAEAEQLPWNGIHLNGVPPPQSAKEQFVEVPSRPVSVSLDPQRSMTDSHANETDEGYFTNSQLDLRSIYSGDSIRMPQCRPGQSLIPRTIPTTHKSSGYSPYGSNPFTPAMDYGIEPTEEQNEAQVQQASPFSCTELGCSFSCKTMSDLKKHNARHKREHICDKRGCTRDGKGFATINDLQRHQKTVHGIQPSHGSSRVYKCFSMNCKHSGKEWPRLDNFKQHLARMHQAEKVEVLVQQSNDWYEREKKPQSASISARGTLSPTSHVLTPSSSQPDEPSSSRQQSQDYLCPTWQPMANAGRLQQPPSSGRTRHSSFSSRLNTSPWAFAPSAPSSSHFHDLDARIPGGHQPGETSLTPVPSYTSPPFPYDLSHQPFRGRLTAAYTVPNPDTSALSDLPNTSFQSFPERFTTDPNDLAQIASNFAPEQHSSSHAPPDHDLRPPSINTNATRQPSEPSTFSPKEAAIQAAPNNQIQNSPIFKMIMRAVMENLGEPGQRLVAALTSSFSSPLTLPRTPNAGSTFGCPEPHCTRVYARACDLKKHLKRHHRPWGCTFSKCYERFGSKFDWKRHELSQHFQQECWKCGLCSNSTATNARDSIPSNHAQVFYKRDLYQTHLRNVHSSSPNTIREHLNTQRIGRDCQSRFWCGFCNAIVALQTKGLPGTDERFNHIDDHFKEGREISTWVGIDGSAAKGHQEGEEEEGVEDMLGEDGVSRTGTGRGEDGDDEAPQEANYDETAAHVNNNGGTGSYVINAQGRLGQKRVHSPDTDLSPSSSTSRPRHRRRTNSPVKKYYYCCQCGDGPQVSENGGNCNVCLHLCCSSCRSEIR